MDNDEELTLDELRAMGFKNRKEYEAFKEREAMMLDAWREATGNAVPFTPDTPVYQQRDTQTGEEWKYHPTTGWQHIPPITPIPPSPDEPPATPRRVSHKSTRDFKTAANAELPPQEEDILPPIPPEQFSLWAETKTLDAKSPGRREDFYTELRREANINAIVYGWRGRLRQEDNIRLKGKYNEEEARHFVTPTDAHALLEAQARQRQRDKEMRERNQLCYIRALVRSGKLSDFPGMTQREGLAGWEDAVHPAVLFAEEEE